MGEDQILDGHVGIEYHLTLREKELHSVDQRDVDLLGAIFPLVELR